MSPAPGMQSGKKITKAERAAERQEKARRLKELEAKRKKRTRIIVIASAVVVIVLVAIIAIKIATASKEVASAANVDANYGVSVSASGAATSEPNASVPQLVIYEDPTCPHCVELHAYTKDALAKHTKAGDVQVTFRTVSFAPLGPTYAEQSEQGAAAIYFVAANAPEHYESFHDALMDEVTGLYAQISDAVTNGAATPGKDQIVEIAASAGVPSDVVEKMAGELGQAKWKNYLDGVYKKFQENGITGTPTVLLDGEEVEASTYGADAASFAQWLDSVAAGTAK